MLFQLSRRDVRTIGQINPDGNARSHVSFAGAALRRGVRKVCTDAPLWCVVGASCAGASGGLMLVGCSGRRRSLCVAGEPACQLGGGGHDRCPREPWNVAIEHECQIPVLPALPGNAHLQSQQNNDWREGIARWM